MHHHRPDCWRRLVSYAETQMHRRKADQNDSLLACLVLCDITEEHSEARSGRLLPASAYAARCAMLFGGSLYLRSKIGTTYCTTWRSLTAASRSARAPANPAAPVSAVQQSRRAPGDRDAGSRRPVRSGTRVRTQRRIPVRNQPYETYTPPILRALPSRIILQRPSLPHLHIHGPPHLPTDHRPLLPQHSFLHLTPPLCVGCALHCARRAKMYLPLPIPLG